MIFIRFINKVLPLQTPHHLKNLHQDYNTVNHYHHLILISNHTHDHYFHSYHDKLDWEVSSLYINFHDLDFHNHPHPHRHPFILLNHHTHLSHQFKPIHNYAIIKYN